MRNRRERVARGIQAAPGGLFLVRSPGGDVFPPPGHKYPGRDDRRRKKWVIFVNVNTSLTRERGEGLTADLNDMTASETMETHNVFSDGKRLAEAQQTPFRRKSGLLAASKCRFAEKVPCLRQANAIQDKV
ncbi:MAG: hypothetical protein ACI3X4_07855 [Bacteroidaceae bacterium]